MGVFARASGLCDSKVEGWCPPGYFLAPVRPASPSMRNGLCACCCLFFAQPCRTFYFRRTAGTAIKCAYGLFQSLRVRHGRAADRDTETRPEGQQVPRAHRSSCALFLCLNECLPPFEACLASRFAAASTASVTMHAAARMHHGRSPNPKHAGWTGRIAVS
jgi:hypothetical protein